MGCFLSPWFCTVDNDYCTGLSLRGLKTITKEHYIPPLPHSPDGSTAHSSRDTLPNCVRFSLSILLKHDFIAINFIVM